MNDLIYDMISLLIKLMCGCAVLFVTYVVAPWLRDNVIPWLKDKQLYSIIFSFVKAAEKSAESGIIDKEAKKQFVIDLLTSRGITVNSDVDALIESAVKDLDLAYENSKDVIIDTVFKEDKDEGSMTQDVLL